VWAIGAVSVKLVLDSLCGTISFLLPFLFLFCGGVKKNILLPGDYSSHYIFSLVQAN
jgi:hypothetical protein